ncbi:hypothetical protein KAI52_00610 [Candidatus Parcubacteria bacterium]|nr:hypothetical protein [Candidatus Parcubacteria bacterium]
MYALTLFTASSSATMVTNVTTGITDGFAEWADILLPVIPILMALGFAFWAIRIIRRKIKI